MTDQQPTKHRGRPNLRQGPQKATKKFRNVHMSYTMKQTIIECFDEIGMASTLLKHFSHLRGVQLKSTRKKIYGWLMKREHIRIKASNPRTADHLCSRELGMATTLPRDSEEQLAQWVHSMRSDGVPVTREMLKIMALETAIDLGLDDNMFAASSSWINGFKRRFGLSSRVRTRTGQDTEGDGAAALDEFSARIENIVRENDIDIIFNADQTAVNYEYLPTRTLNPKREKTVWVKCGGKTKDRATAMVLADSRGN
ncbi:hypothetical protein As57867_002867, partial [Aphanomyces stellatus]